MEENQLASRQSDFILFIELIMVSADDDIEASIESNVDSGKFQIYFFHLSE